MDVAFLMSNFYLCSAYTVTEFVWSLWVSGKSTSCEVCH